MNLLTGLSYFYRYSPQQTQQKQRRFNLAMIQVSFVTNNVIRWIILNCIRCPRYFICRSKDVYSLKHTFLHRDVFLYLNLQLDDRSYCDREEGEKTGNIGARKQLNWWSQWIVVRNILNIPPLYFLRLRALQETFYEIGPNYSNVFGRK